MSLSDEEEEGEEVEEAAHPDLTQGPPSKDEEWDRKPSVGSWLARPPEQAEQGSARDSPEAAEIWQRLQAEQRATRDTPEAGAASDARVADKRREALADKKSVGDVALVAFGYTLVAVGSVFKLPQILQMWRSRSAESVSLPATAVSLANTVFMVAFAVDQGHPLSTYGEMWSHIVCTTVQLLQVLRYKQNASAVRLARWAAGAGLGTLVACRARLLLGDQAGGAAVHTMQASGTALGLVEKLLQISELLRTRSAGQLSLTTLALALAGNCSRLFTTVQQLGRDPAVMAPHLCGVLTNMIVVGLVLAYGRRGR